MIIAKNKVVSLHYRLSEDGGEELENNKDSLPMTYLHGYGNLLNALEEQLVGLETGAVKSVILQAHEAYGTRNESALQRTPIKHLIGKYKRLLPGMVVKVNTSQGTKNARIIKTGKFNVDLDMNHPLAGKNLKFDVEIVDIRDASPEEIQHGHVHGPGGHHH